MFWYHPGAFESRLDTRNHLTVWSATMACFRRLPEACPYFPIVNMSRSSGEHYNQNLLPD